MSNQQNQTISCECFCLEAFVDASIVMLKQQAERQRRHAKSANLTAEITPLPIAAILFPTLKTSFSFVLKQ